MNNTYIGYELSKTGLKIPQFTSGKLIHSKYDPEKEAQNLADRLDHKTFFVITGIGAGFFIEKLSNKFNNSKIIAIENTKNDLIFLEENFPIIKKLKLNNNIIFSTMEDLYNNLLENYIPAIYPSFQLIEYRSWITENQESTEKIKNTISLAIKKISEDFSVQAHFGKFWQHNIISNLKQLNQNTQITFPNNKKAIIVAAGPSLDDNINWIRENRNDLYIFSTDTAYKTLQKQKIFCDAVVSIDGQSISHQHFLREINKETVFIFDLCGNSSSIKKIKKNGNKIIFTTTGHPLSYFAKKTQNNSFNLIYTDAGSGTVTIAALDFANKAGFKEIHVIGADFSFPKRKPYAKGTYLEDLYINNHSRISNLEKNYTTLMYRTKTIEKNKIQTTELLQSYKDSFDNWLKNNNFSFYQKDQKYICQSNLNLKTNSVIQQKFDFKNFADEIQKKDLSKMTQSLLPYISYLRMQDSKKNIERNFETLLNIAVNHIVRYTKVL